MEWDNEPFENINSYLEEVIKPLLPNAKYTRRNVFCGNVVGLGGDITSCELFKNSLYEVNENIFYILLL